MPADVSYLYSMAGSDVKSHLLRSAASTSQFIVEYLERSKLLEHSRKAAMFNFHQAKKDLDVLRTEFSKVVWDRDAVVTAKEEAEKLLTDKQALWDSKDKAAESLAAHRLSQIENVNHTLTGQKNKVKEAKKVMDKLSQNLANMTKAKEAAEKMASHAVEEFKNSEAGSKWLLEYLSEYASKGALE